MTVSPISATTTNASAQTREEKSLGNYQMFLQLLVTELKNQDPTKPVDPTQTVTQLATFSSLEQAVRTNSLLSALNQQAAFSQGASLINRTITSADGAQSGKVESVTVSNTGLVANLADGGQLTLGPGVSIA